MSIRTLYGNNISKNRTQGHVYTVNQFIFVAINFRDFPVIDVFAETYICEIYSLYMYNLCKSLRYNKHYKNKSLIEKCWFTVSTQYAFLSSIKSLKVILVRI